MNHRRGLAFAVPFLIVGIIGQLVFPQIIESAQIASIAAIILASTVAYFMILILDGRDTLPAWDILNSCTLLIEIQWEYPHL